MIAGLGLVCFTIDAAVHSNQTESTPALGDSLLVETDNSAILNAMKKAAI